MILKVKRRWQNFLFVVDLALIFISILLAFYLRESLVYFFANKIFQVTVLLVFVLETLALYILEAYNIDETFKSFKFISQYIFSFFIITVSLAFIFYIFPFFGFGRGILALHLFFSFFFLFFWRLFWEKFLYKLNYKRKIALICASKLLKNKKELKKLIDLIDDSRYFSLAGLVYFNGAEVTDEFKDLFLGRADDLQQIITYNNLAALVVADDYNDKELEKNILAAKLKGILLYDLVTLYEKLAGKLPVSYLSDYWIIFRAFAGITDSWYNKRVKRLLDLLISFSFFILVLPLLLITSLAIKLSSKGPLLYEQTRVGLNEKEFKIIKFRSMEVNAEKKTGVVWAKDNDPRVTFVGKIIRRLRIDELPQLYNIIRGDMTLIGPRPERPEFVKELQKEIPYYSLRYAVKPGLTGWAQINYGYGASVGDALEKLQYDLYYIRHSSFLIDLKILLKTVRVILLLIGSR